MAVPPLELEPPLYAMASPPQSPTADFARPVSARYQSLLQEATKDHNEIDQVCHRASLANTRQIQTVLSLLRKWSEGAEERYGAEAMEFLRSRGLAMAAKSDRRKVELSRVLKLRKDSDKPAPETESSQQATTGDEAPPAPPTSTSVPVNMIVEAPMGDDGEKLPPQDAVVPNALPTPQSADRPQHEVTNGAGSRHTPPPDNSPQIVPAPGPDELSTDANILYCLLCQKGPVDCTHSHRLISKLMDRGLQHASQEEKEVALGALFHMRNGGRSHLFEPYQGSSIGKVQRKADRDAWITILQADLGRLEMPARHRRKSKSLGSNVEVAKIRKSDEIRASLPLNAPDIAAHRGTPPNVTQGPHSHAAFAGGYAPTSNLDPRAMMNGHPPDRPRDSAQAPPNIQEIPTSGPKRRSREERQWCAVCKSDPYWCIHRSGLDDPMPRSARFEAPGYYEGRLDSPMRDSPEEEAFSHTEQAHRQQPTPILQAAQAAPPQLPLPNGGYRDSGVRLSSNDEELRAARHDMHAQEPDPDGHREKRRKVSGPGREEELRVLFDSIPRGQLARAMINLCLSNSLVDGWVRSNLEAKDPSQPPAAPARPTAPMEEPPPRMSAVPEIQSRMPERSYRPEVVAICRNCTRPFDLNAYPEQQDCHFHPGKP